MSSMGHRKKWGLFFIFFCFSLFLLVSRAFSSTPLVHKGRTNYKETSWYLAASQAVITSNYRSVIMLSTRDFWSQFVWLLPYRRQDHIFCFPLWSRYYHRLPRPWSHLITSLWSRFPLVNCNRNLYGYCLLWEAKPHVILCDHASSPA